MRLGAGTTAAVSPTTAFLSYSHRDEPLRVRLETHLAALRRTGKLDIWNDRIIRPGESWSAVIDENLRTADLVLLLLSPDFVESDYCWGVEMQIALERHREGLARVVPLFLSRIAGWQDLPFADLQGLPTDARWLSDYLSSEEWFADVAMGLSNLLRSNENFKRSLPQSHDRWWMSVDADPEEFGEARRLILGAALRKALATPHLDCIEVRRGSTELCFEGTDDTYRAMVDAHRNGRLEPVVGAPVIRLSKPVGALVHLAAREAMPGESVKSRLQIIDEPHWEPILTGMEVLRDNPIQPGFHVAVDERASPPDAAELTARLGRYFNTFLVVSGEHLNVNLSPFEEFCGVPPLLRGTELGRDLLAQDFLLKEYTALLLHPDTDTGSVFWNLLEKKIDEEFEACMRVWITPGRASIRETATDAGGRATIEGLGLDVYCEEDYAVLRAADIVAPANPSHRALTDAFRTRVLPHIENEVRLGNRFSRLRQIHSAQILAEWLRKKMGDALSRFDFVDSNDPERFGLVTCPPSEQDVRERYLSSFREGVWRWTRTEFADAQTKSRVYIAGGIMAASCNVQRVDKVRPTAAARFRYPSDIPN